MIQSVFMFKSLVNYNTHILDTNWTTYHWVIKNCKQANFKIVPSHPVLRYLWCFLLEFGKYLQILQGITR